MNYSCQQYKINVEVNKKFVERRRKPGDINN